MVAMMNSGHGAMADWGFQFVHISQNAVVLDCGCGGGANIKKLLEKCLQGTVKGILEQAGFDHIRIEKQQRLDLCDCKKSRN